tara:strand:- start:1745 stop:2356 length:612 start_codon:yes stop_codon:yes gene_type:complete
MINLEPNYLGTANSDYYKFYHIKNGLSLHEIENLTKYTENNFEFKKGRTGVAEYGNDDSESSNNRDIAYINPDNHNKWLYDKLSIHTMAANDLYYNFDIDAVTDAIHYVIYPEDGGHLNWHMDIGAMGVNRRKLAMTVQLSDPSEYEGGDFQIWMGGSSGFVTLPREQGDIIIFPTFLMHRVTPITKGERRCLVFWSGGRPFR